MLNPRTDNSLYFISKATQFAESRGITLEIGCDFNFYEAVINNQPHRNFVGPRFSPDAFRSENKLGFWILGMDASGELVHTQAVRLVELEGNSLASHMEKRLTEYISDTFDHKKLRFRAGPGSRAIKGTVCYHGEFWLKGGDDGFRGADLAAPLTCLAMVISLLKWELDYIFSIIRSTVILKGLAARAGFLHTEPGSMFLPYHNQDDEVEAWIAWVGVDDIHHLINTFLDRKLHSLENSKTLQQGELVA